MSIPVLIEVYDEMRRLAIAGSTVAPGDFRLKKLVPPLTKSGEKSPVFAKVAQAVQAVVDSNEKTASTSLLELTTLVNAILYTQVKRGRSASSNHLRPSTSANRPHRPAPACSNHCWKRSVQPGRPIGNHSRRRGPRRVQRPSTGQAGPPCDRRSVSRIGQLIARKVLPAYGKAILPELRKTLDIKGRAGHLHRLNLLHQLDPEGSRELVQQVLSDGSKEMKVAAIECLGGKR